MLPKEDMGQSPHCWLPLLTKPCNEANAVFCLHPAQFSGGVGIRYRRCICMGFVSFWVLTRLLCSDIFLREECASVQSKYSPNSWSVVSFLFCSLSTHFIKHSVSQGTQEKTSCPPLQQNDGADHDRDHDHSAMEVVIQKLRLLCLPMFVSQQ